MKIIFLTDYKNCFGSKYNAEPYRSGLDKEKLASFFLGYGIEARFIPYYKINIDDPLLNENIYIHDSIEDIDYLYKAYIEDLVLALEIKNVNVFPGFRFLRAHNNKVFMELLRRVEQIEASRNLNFSHYGCYEDYLNDSTRLFPTFVIKGAQDAQGRQVRLGHNNSAATKSIKSISRSKQILSEIKEIIRSVKYKGYIKESKYRRKYILQEFVPGLQNDWKVLVFGDKYYILRRGIRNGDFRASGSKTNYGFGSDSTPPKGIFDFAEGVFDQFNVPYASFDIAWDKKYFYLIEFQMVCFGSSTQLKSDCYYIKTKNQWTPVFELLDLETLYAESLLRFFNKKGLIDEDTIREEW
jgi:hypothetical protein